MNVYDEDKSFRLFNKYCNNNFVCVVSKWGKKTHQEINREYKGKYLEDIYANFVQGAIARYSLEEILK